MIYFLQIIGAKVRCVLLLFNINSFIFIQYCAQHRQNEVISQFLYNYVQYSILIKSYGLYLCVLFFQYFCLSNSLLIRKSIMINRHIIFFILSVGLVLNIYGATELRSTQMRTSDGLPNNSIRYIYQDTKGFLWLATLNGLSRYDGNSFLTFRPQAGDKVSLSDNP